MKTAPTDTSTNAEELLTELLRSTPVWKRLKMVEELNESLQILAKADLRRRYPEANEKELKKRLAARLLEREEVIAAYGWDPEVEGY
jgi:hypothetical protein